VRIPLAIAIWVVMVGGLLLYMSRTEQHTTAGETTRPAARGEFTIQIVATCTLGPDPFTGLLDEPGKAPAVLVMLNGVEVLRFANLLASGKAVASGPLEGMIVGDNEFFVEANPIEGDLWKANAVRVRVLRDGETVIEKTFWTEVGVPLKETFPLSVQTAARKGDEHGR